VNPPSGTGGVMLGAVKSEVAPGAVESEVV